MDQNIEPAIYLYLKDIRALRFSETTGSQDLVVNSQRSQVLLGSLHV